MTTTSPTLLVSGGRGFIGRYVCQAATRAGYQVTTLGRGADNDVVRDLLDPQPGWTQGGFDYAINLAAYSDHAATCGLDAATVRANSARMLSALREHGPFHKRAIHVSSSEVFGDRRDHPLGWARVDDPYQLESLYAQGKAEQERWADLYGFHSVRVTNVWGDGQPQTKAYPRIRAAVLQGQPLTDRTGGDPVQWSPVAEVAERLVELLTEPALRRREHLAPARAATFTRFVEAIATDLGRPAPPIEDGEPLVASLGILPTLSLSGAA